MGTNYCLHTDPCEHCGTILEPLHIGKSSAGWVFALRVYPERGLNTLEDWLTLLTKNATYILDEYSEDVTLAELLDVICNRKAASPTMGTDNLLRENDAERGPRYLARAEVDGTRCVGHGPGTWSYFVGDFS